MLRISAFIAILALTVTTSTGVSAAQPQIWMAKYGSAMRQCNMEKCVQSCQESGRSKQCDRWCQQKMANCK